MFDFIALYLCAGIIYWIWFTDWNETKMVVIPTWPIDLIIRTIKYYKNYSE